MNGYIAGRQAALDFFTLAGRLVAWGQGTYRLPDGYLPRQDACASEFSGYRIHPYVERAPVVVDSSRAERNHIRRPARGWRRHMRRCKAAGVPPAALPKPLQTSKSRIRRALRWLNYCAPAVLGATCAPPPRPGARRRGRRAWKREEWLARCPRAAGRRWAAEVDALYRRRGL